MNTCERYLKFMLKSFDYNEQKLKSCVQFHLYNGVKRRANFDERFSKLIELMGSPENCPEEHEDINLC